MDTNQETNLTAAILGAPLRLLEHDVIDVAEAAVNDDCCAVDKTRFITNEKCDETCNFLRFAVPAQGRDFDGLERLRRGHAGIDPPGRQCVNSDIATAKVISETLRQVDESSFGSRVCHGVKA